MTALEQLVATLVDDSRLTGATLSRPSSGDPSQAIRVTIDPVLVQGALRYRWTSHHRAQALDENLTPEETARRLTRALGGEFRQGLLHGTDADWQVLAGGKSPKLLRRPATRPQARLHHDRSKRRILPEGTPVPFLVELGVMTPEGKVRARRYDKFRQVSRFLELVDDVADELPGGTLRVVDFGSGRSYLTFALHHLLTEVYGRDVELVGLDLQQGVVAECTALAERLGTTGLRFEVGDIAGFDGVEGADLVVSLHACDTATDAALDRAVRAGASVILAVPCCQHELRPQLESRELEPFLRFGILRERFAAEVTDAVRALLLGAVGYDTQIVEFVELEHTPKNLLIRAVSRPARDRSRSLSSYRTLQQALGIDPALERLLGELLSAT